MVWKSLTGILVAAAVAVGGLHYWNDVRGPGPLRVCENIVKAYLRSPSSYNRISFHQYGDSVTIEYDAANSYGALLRGYAQCQYPVAANSSLGFDDIPIPYRVAINGKDADDFRSYVDRAQREARSF